MTRWRLTIALILLLVIALPLAAPVGQLLSDPTAWRSWTEASRLLALARNTFFLIAGTLALALPTGIAGAVLLYRTDLPLRRFWRLLTLLTLFVPLPLFTSGWQAVLGSGGWLPVPAWSGSGAVWTPWGQGIGSAIWIHAVAALPWVILLVGQGLSWVERELEEDALTLMPSWCVLLSVTLPRAGAALGAAALWVSLQAATEITVTDVMQVRTFAEEVYTQIVGGPDAEEGVARAVAATLPFVLLVAILVGCVARFWERRLPARMTLLTGPLVFRLGRWRWPLVLVVALLCGLLLAMPLGSLVWRAGLTGTPPSWSAGTTARYLVRACRPPEGWMLLENLLLVAGTGAIVAAAGLLACWAARGSRWFRGGVLVLMATAWAMPGPLIGLGLKMVIDRLLTISDSPWLAQVLYHGPSPLPLMWVDAIRFFPCAVAILWPVTRLMPAELSDAARVDGATPGQELRRVVWPLTSTAYGQAALAVAVLSLGELSAGKLVATPGMPGYATEIFTQMHYGVTNELAARCVLLLILVTIAACGLAFGQGR
ncbi:MAG TPA: ABC transporter permease subunit [Gemmataceae bacterium]|nr:ABC transporter permease subunit [Gemmataceae bacterium]